MGVMFPGMGRMGEIRGFASKKYYQKVIKQYGASIIAYWPLWEASGIVAADISGNTRDAAYTGVDLGQPGIGDGKTSPYFDGTNDFCNIYSASLASAFNGVEGTMMLWINPTAVQWAAGTAVIYMELRVDNANRCLLLKPSTPKGLQFLYNSAGGTLANHLYTYGTAPTTFIHLAMTWSKAADQCRAYLNGAEIAASPKTGLGNFTGALSSTRCCIGADSTTPGSPAQGNFAHAIVLNRAATPAEIAITATVP